MLLICLAVVFSALLRLGEAQSSSTTSSAAAATHTVSVGAAGLVFTPDTITANVGDIVEYLFYPQNHSVARADFKSPCIPYEISGPGRVGFWAGFHPLNVVPSNPPSYQVKINDTSPIFFYCSAPGACIEDGMVGVINPNDTQTLAIQKAYAKNATIDFSPGESFPIESASSKSSSAAPTSTSSSAPSSTAPATTTTTPTTTSTPTPTTAATESKPALSGGAIAGIVIGGAAVVVLAGALIYLCGRQRTLGEMVTQQQQHPPPHGPPSYLPGHLSMASGTTYPPKTPKFDVDSLGARRYSGQVAHPGFYDRSATETESYRSRSPPFDEGRELAIPNMQPAMSSGQTSPGSPTRGGSPLIRRPVPERPTPVSPLEEQIYQPLTADVPAALRVDRNSSQRGPHELDVESGRDYYPYIHDPDPGYGHGQGQGQGRR